MSRTDDVRHDFKYNLGSSTLFSSSSHPTSVKDNLEALIEIGLLTISGGHLLVYLQATLNSDFALNQQMLFCLKLYQVSQCTNGTASLMQSALKISCEHATTRTNLDTRLKMHIAQNAMQHYEPGNKSKNEAIQHQAIALTRFIFSGDSELGLPNPDDNRPTVSILTEYADAFENYEKGFDLTFLNKPPTAEDCFTKLTH